MDINKAKGVVAFVGSLFIIMIVGSIYFFNWDKSDRNKLQYIKYFKSEKSKKKSK